jgi:putative membrane-bound dehydrogenase-like protein
MQPIRLLAAFAIFATAALSAAEPTLRVFIRGGKKSHGPNAHEHERFLRDWQELLKQRGIQADGALDWPTAEQFARTDVLVLYAQEGGNANDTQKADLQKFIQRGGGLVVIHTASVAKDTDWWREIIGGAWRHGTTQWKEGPMDLYFVESQKLGDPHPVTRGASNFHLDDEIYYDMDLRPDIRVLATSYTPKVRDGKKQAAGGKAHIYDIQPQIWSFERTAEGGSRPYRAFVSLPGHLYGTFALPQYRALLLRAMAWTGGRANVDEFVKPEEVEAMLYPVGGPQKPADTLQALEIHPEFNLRLVAAEPLINKPMNVDWDPAGRLWVAETPEYPNGRRGMRPDYRGKEWKDRGGVDFIPGQQDRPAIDKISVLTDSDGDGVMDRKQVFHEGLDLVTGLVFHRDGVIVTQAPDILWLRDTDGDGRCDKVETLYTGLGTGDTHAVINNPRWGWDGWIYATHGYSGSGNVRNPEGKCGPVGIGSGVIRFKADGSAIEQYSSKGGNTWGLTITGDNRVMWTQPTSGALLMHTVLPEYALARGKVGKQASFHVVEPSPKSFPLMSWEQMAYVQIDWVGSFTAAAGTTLYDGGSWPAEYHGDYLTTEPTINVIHHTRLKPQGSSYTASKLPGREETEFIRSRDMWWRPIETRVGPDGAVYILDFYNQAVIHNDTRGPDHNKVNAAVRPDRDHYFGRVWRLDHRQAQALTVPDLTRAPAAERARALAHPSSHVRLTASRLLAESGQGAAEVAALWEKADASTRIAALWTLHRLGGLPAALLTAALGDADAHVRRNAALVIEAGAAAPGDALQSRLTDAEASVRLAALRALAATELADSAAQALVAAWPRLDDDFQRSAAVGAATRNPSAVIGAALNRRDPGLVALVDTLVQGIGERHDAVAAGRLVESLAARAEEAGALERSILDTLARSLKQTPPASPSLTAALRKLLAGPASGSALPLAARWDAGGELKAEVSRLAIGLRETLTGGGADAARLTAARSLLGLRSADAAALATVAGQLGGPASPALQKDLVIALGETQEDAVGGLLTGAFAKLPAAAQVAAFDTLLQRAEWATALLNALQAKTVEAALLGPADLHRLRTHPNREVAQRAGPILDALRSPDAARKDEVIARYLPEMGKPANLANGRTLFMAACATCHKLGDLGADIGPALTGMGAHGPSELLLHVIDPNREVDPSFVTWNIETRDGNSYAGVIARENPSAVVLRSLAGEQEIRTADIKSRVNTGKSLMPEGLEALGAEALRDILAFMGGEEATRFRMLDLKDAFTASTVRGLYGDDGPNRSLDIRKAGTRVFNGIPFNVVTPEKSANGLNVINLKGGPGGSFSKQKMPRQVEIKSIGFTANRLHFLGGIGGWAHPFSDGVFPVMKATVHFTDGDRQVLEFRNGVEFADHIARRDVPGSTFAPDVSQGFQVRWFSKALKKTGVIDRVELESLDNSVAPTTLAITAELAGPDAQPLPPEPAAAPPPAALNWGPSPKVLLVGGGSSHDFQKYFNLADTAILNRAGIASVHYTESSEVTAAELKNVDVLVMSTNKGGFPTPAFREALTAFVESGKGVVLLHPAVWYNWGAWPDYNARFVAGGSRGHDKIREFTVTAKGKDHPLLQNVPARFAITDELYYVNLLPEAAVEVLIETEVAEGTKKTHPSVWTVRHPKARIACIALGHDGRAHDLPAFQSLLVNAVRWAAGGR